MSRSTSRRGSSASAQEEGGLYTSGLHYATSPHRDSPPVSAGPSPMKEALYGSPLAHGRKKRRSSSLSSQPEDLYNPDIRSSFHPQPIYLKVPNKDEQEMPGPLARRPWVDDSHNPSQGPPREGQPTNKLALEALALRQQLDVEEERNQTPSQTVEKKEAPVAASAATTAVPTASPALGSTGKAENEEPSAATDQSEAEDSQHAWPVDTTIEQQTLYEMGEAADEAETALSAIRPGSTQLRTPQSAQADESVTAPYTDDATITRLLYSMTSKGGAEGATMLSALTEATVEEEEEGQPSLPCNPVVVVVDPLATADAGERQDQAKEEQHETELDDAHEEEEAAPTEKGTSSSSFIVRATDSKSPSPEEHLSERSSRPAARGATAEEWEDWQSTSSRPHTSSASSASSRRGFRVLTGTSRTFGRTEAAAIHFGSPGGPPTASASSERGAPPSLPAEQTEVKETSPPATEAVAAAAAAAAAAPSGAPQPSNARESFPASSESDPHGEFFEEIESMYSRSREASSDSDKQKGSKEREEKQPEKSPSAVPAEPEVVVPVDSATEPLHTGELKQALSSPQEEQTDVIAATREEEGSISAAAHAELPVVLAPPPPEIETAVPAETVRCERITAESKPAPERKNLLPPHADAAEEQDEVQKTERVERVDAPAEQVEVEEMGFKATSSHNSNSTSSSSSKPRSSHDPRKSKAASEGRYIDLSGIEHSPPISTSDYLQLAASQMDDPLRLRAEEEPDSIREVPATAHDFANHSVEESPEPHTGDEEIRTSQKEVAPVFRYGTSADSSIDEHFLYMYGSAPVEPMEPPYSPKQSMELEQEVDKEEAQPLNEYSTFFPVSGSGARARSASGRGGRCSPPFRRKSPQRSSPEAPWTLYKRLSPPNEQPQQQQQQQEPKAETENCEPTPVQLHSEEIAEPTPAENQPQASTDQGQEEIRDDDHLPDLSTLMISAITESTPSKLKASPLKSAQEEKVDEKPPRRSSSSSASRASAGSSSTHFTEERPSAAAASHVEAIEEVHNDMKETDSNTESNHKATETEPETEREKKDGDGDEDGDGDGERKGFHYEEKEAEKKREVQAGDENEETREDEEEEEDEKEEATSHKYSLSTIERLRAHYRKQHAKVQEELLDVEREEPRIFLEDYVKERQHPDVEEAVEKGTIPCPVPPKQRGRSAFLVSPHAPNSSSSNSNASSAPPSPTEGTAAVPVKEAKAEKVYPHATAQFLVADAQAAATAIAAQVSALLAEENLARRFMEENEQEHLVATRRLVKCMQDAFDVSYLYAREEAAREAIGAEAQRSTARVREAEELRSVDREVQQLRETVREIAVCIETENVVRVTVMDKEEKQRQEMQQLFQLGVAAQMRQEDARRRALTLETEEALEDLAYAEKHARETLRISEVRTRARLYEEVGRLMERERQLFLHQVSQHTLSGSSLLLQDHHEVEGSAPQFFEWAPTTNESSSSFSRKLQNSSADATAAHPPSPSLHLPSGTLLTSSNTTGNSTYKTSSSNNKDGGARQPMSVSGSREQRSPTHIAAALSGGDTSVLLHALQQTQERVRQELRQRTTPQNTETTKSLLKETEGKDETTLAESPCRHLYSEEDRTLRTEEGEAAQAEAEADALEEPAAEPTASAKKKKKVRINTAQAHVHSSQREFPLTRHSIPCSLHNKPTLSSLMKKYARLSDKERKEQEEEEAAAASRQRSPLNRCGSNGRQQKSPHRPYSDDELYNYDKTEYLSSPTYIDGNTYAYAHASEEDEEEEEDSPDCWSTQANASPRMEPDPAARRQSLPHTTESEPSFSNVPREVFPQDSTVPAAAGSQRASPTNSPPRVPYGCRGTSPIVEIVVDGSPYRDVTVSPTTVGRNSPSRSPSRGPRYAAPTAVSARHQCEVLAAHALNESVHSSSSRHESPRRSRRGITCSAGVPKRFSSPAAATVITRVAMERGPGVWSAAPSPRNPFGLDGLGHRAMVAVRRREQWQQQEETGLPGEHVLATTQTPLRAGSARREHPARAARPLADPMEEENSRMRRELSSGGVAHLPESMRRGFAVPQHCALPEVARQPGGRSKAVATYAPYDLCRTYTPKYTSPPPPRRTNSSRRQPTSATRRPTAPRKAPYSYVNTFYQANSKQVMRKCDAVNQLGSGARVLVDFVPRTMADRSPERNHVGDIHIVEDDEEEVLADPFYPTQQLSLPPRRPLYPPAPSLLITTNDSSTGLAAPKYLRGEMGGRSHSNSRMAEQAPLPSSHNDPILFHVRDEDEVVCFDSGDYYEANRSNQYVDQFWKQRKDRRTRETKKSSLLK